MTNQRQLTQWAAQFAVASELCKNGYQVSFTLGHNTPLADLVVIGPKGTYFLIDVKGLANRNYWQIAPKRQQPQSDLFYVLALVPRGEANQYFVLKQATVNALIDDEFGRLTPKQQKLGIHANRLGLRWKDTEGYKDKWECLPDWPTSASGG